MKRNILDAIADGNLFRPWFKDPATWQSWRAFLAALFALPMGEAELAIYRQCTGRSEAPSVPATEGWLICGRRAGKSFALALTSVYLAAFHSYRQYLAPGERGTVMIIARDRRQTRIILGYIRALLTEVPMLRQMVQRETAEGFDLSNGVTIECQTASYRSVRGYTCVACLIDEIAFLPTDDAADPDYAVIDALRPTMATIPGAMLLCASSPYAKRGALHDAFTRHFVKDGDPVLVWKAPTRTMNPTVAQRVIDEAMARDPADASAEWMAEFRSDLESFISREAVMGCVDAGVLERPPIAGIRYESFTDPSGGSSDSMVGGIAHLEGELVMIDALREIAPPFDPESATDELVGLYRRYGVRETNGDAYSAAWCRTAFERRNVVYRHCELVRSQLYLNLLPSLNSRTVRLLDNPRCVNQLSALERRATRGGRDSIDHPRDQHDDSANCIAGLVYVVAQRPKPGEWWIGAWGLKPRRFDDIGDDNPNPQSPGCTVPLTEPHPQTVERWARHAEYLRTKSPF